MTVKKTIIKTHEIAMFTKTQTRIIKLAIPCDSKKQ